MKENNELYNFLILKGYPQLAKLLDNPKFEKEIIALARKRDKDYNKLCKRFTNPITGTTYKINKKGNLEIIK